MAFIKIRVPDGDKCTGCDFLKSKWCDDGGRMGYDRYYCNIFGNEVESGKKCVACKLLSEPQVITRDFG